MIIVKIMEGLGNQLFQYAFGRAIAYHRNVSLKFDLSFYKNYHSREYLLGHFNISVPEASDAEIDYVKYGKDDYLRPFRIIIQKFLPYYLRRIVVEKIGIGYDHNMLKAQNNAYYVGYWSAYYKLFKDISHLLEREITLSHTMDINIQNYLNKIKDKQSVSIHFRRGDYLKNENLKFFGVQPIEYYYNAVNYINSKISNPYFFIFSDDINWVQEYFQLDSPHEFISQNNESQAFYDLILMSECKNHIIANSSFSWWGAWLNKNHNKIVIAPQKWYANNMINANHFIPENWIRI